MKTKINSKRRSVTYLIEKKKLLSGETGYKLAQIIGLARYQAKVSKLKQQCYFSGYTLMHFSGSVLTPDDYPTYIILPRKDTFPNQQ